MNKKLVLIGSIITVGAVLAFISYGVGSTMPSSNGFFRLLAVIVTASLAITEANLILALIRGSVKQNKKGHFELILNSGKRVIGYLVSIRKDGVVYLIEDELTHEFHLKEIKKVFIVNQNNEKTEISVNKFKTRYGKI